MTYFYFHQKICSVFAAPFTASRISWEAQRVPFSVFVEEKGEFDIQGISYALYRFLYTVNFQGKVFIDFDLFSKLHEKFDLLGVEKTLLRRNKNYVLSNKEKENTLEFVFKDDFSQLPKISTVLDLLVIYDFHKMPNYKTDRLVNEMWHNFLGLNNSRVLLFGKRSKTEPKIWTSFVSSNFINQPRLNVEQESVYSSTYDDSASYQTTEILEPSILVDNAPQKLPLVPKQPAPVDDLPKISNILHNLFK